MTTPVKVIKKRRKAKPDAHMTKLLVMAGMLRKAR